MPTFLWMKRAAGLSLNLHKTNIVNFGLVAVSDLGIAPGVCRLRASGPWAHWGQDRGVHNASTKHSVL